MTGCKCKDKESSFEAVMHVDTRRQCGQVSKLSFCLAGEAESFKGCYEGIGIVVSWIVIGCIFHKESIINLGIRIRSH